MACIPLQSIIDWTGLNDIDLFSLDVEGAELAVLTTVNFNLTNIHVIVVELDGGNATKDQQVRDHLIDHGFKNAASELGSIRDACLPGGDCTINEVFINHRFNARKVENSKKRKSLPKHFSYGTGMTC